MIARCIYTSTPTVTGAASDISTIVRSARLRNAEFRITGYLIQAETHYLQFVEGPEQHLTQLMINIRKDPRHHDIVELPFSFAPTREFSGWSMGFTSTVGEDQFVTAIRTIGAGITPERIAQRLHEINARYTA